MEEVRALWHFAQPPATALAMVEVCLHLRTQLLQYILQGHLRMGGGDGALILKQWWMDKEKLFKGFEKDILTHTDDTEEQNERQ